MAKNFISLFVQKACVQLGFPGAKRPTHSSQFGYGLEKIWMDNMHCYGTEDTLTDCRYFIKISLMVSYFYYYGEILSDRKSFPIITNTLSFLDLKDGEYMIVKELRQLVCNVKRNHPQQLQHLLQQLQGFP